MSEPTTNPSAADVKHTLAGFEGHSPLPWNNHGWEISDVSDYGVALIDGETTTPEGDEINARLIVHCVNNFPDLLDALRACERALKMLTQNGVVHRGLPTDAMKAARVALAKAGAR